MAASDGDNTPEKTRALKPAWQSGQSGNPAGRPKGSRNRLGEAFLADMLVDWEANGVDAIVAVREEKPDQYLKVVASILPKELNLRVSEFDDLTDDQLARQLAAIASQLAGAGIEIGEGIEAAEGTATIN